MTLSRSLSNPLPRQNGLTLRDAWRYLTSAFNRAELTFGHGLETAFDEAWALISHVLCLPFGDAAQRQCFLSASLSAKEIATINRLAKKRLQGIPMPYITGEAWLAGYAFRAEAGVIIPRSLLANLLVGRLTPWIADNRLMPQILELCCGSASLMILAAMAFPEAVVDGIDIDDQALIAAKRNIDDYALAGRINLFRGDLYSALPKDRKHSYDLIIANPPYVRTEDMKQLPREYRAEPALALDGGKNGLKVVERIINGAADYLTENGFLLLELGDNAQAFVARYNQLPVLWLDNDSGEQCVALIRAGDL